jgi:transcriptional regulator
MYVPPAFRDDDRASLHAIMRASQLANLITADGGVIAATPVPLLLEADEGPEGVLYGHVARANPFWKTKATGDALAIFMGPDAYVSPSWYANKPMDGRVVPTYNYVTVQAYGPVEFFEDAERLRSVVTRLTDLYETPRATPWAVTDAPPAFIDSQLRGIVGLRMPITRLVGKRKLSQNRQATDRIRVAEELANSERPADRSLASAMPKVEPS